MSDIANAFLIIGMTIMFGFVSVWVAKKYRIPQVITLMLFGVVLGPLTGIIDVGPKSVILNIYPFMSSLALIILLFDGGISLNIFNVFETITESMIFTFVVFIASIFAALILVPLFHFTILNAIIIGSLLAGISSAIVIALIDGLKMNEDTRSMLTLESVLNDSLVIIALFLLIQIHTDISHVSFAGIIQKLSLSFIIAAVIGGAGAYVWNYVLKMIKEYELDYMLTLAVLFIIYFLATFLNGNGGLAVFIFGLVFGNLHNLPSKLLSFSILQQEKIKGFQEEVTFFTRTFFFTYIGLLFPLYQLNTSVIVISVALTAVFVLVRYLCTYVMIKDVDANDKNLIAGMLPRGLAAAVGVGLLMQNNIFIPNVKQIVFSVIFLTNVLATIAVYEYAGKVGEEDDDEFVKKIAANVKEGGEKAEDEPKEEKVEETKPVKEEQKEETTKQKEEKDHHHHKHHKKGNDEESLPPHE